MKKILVIEDEFNQFESLFNYVNDIYMENELSFTNVVKSQDLNPFSSLSAYDMVFVDIAFALADKITYIHKFYIKHRLHGTSLGATRNKFAFYYSPSSLLS